MQRCTRQLQLAGYVCVLPATLAVAALSSLCTSDTGHSDDGVTSASWLGTGLGSSGSCHAPTGAHSSWLHVLCVAACWSLLLWQVLGLARRCVCLQRSCEVSAALEWAQACNSSDDQQQQQQQRGWPASRRHARAAAKVAPPPADTAAAAAAAQGRAYRSLRAVALGPWSLVATPPPVPDPQHFRMLHLLRQLSECFTAQHVHIRSLAKPQRSSADSRLQPAPYSACSEHLVCSVKVYASWVHAPWLHPLLLRSLHQALAHTGVGSPAAAAAPGSAGTSHRAPLSSSSCRGTGATSWAAQALVFRGCVHMLASAYRAKSVAAAAAAAAAAEDVAAFAGADQDWYRRRLLDRLTEGLQAQQALPQVEAAVGAAQEQDSSAAPRPQHSTGAASNRDSGVWGVARLRVLWQEQPVLLADAAHRQLVVLHVGYDLQQQGTAHQQPAQVQEVCSQGSAAQTAQEPHATAVPATAAGGSGSSGVGPDMMVRVLVFGHQQMLLDAAVRLGPVLRVWMPTVPTGLYHLALLPPAPIKGAGPSSASAAPLLMHPLLALPGPVADEVNRMWSTNSVLTGAVPRTVAALAAVMGVPGPAQDADPFAAAAAADQGAPPAPAASQSPAAAGAACGSSDRAGPAAAAPATAAAAAAAAPSGGGGGMALAALFRSFEECASSILAGAVYPGTSRSWAGGHSLGGGPAPPPQPAALVDATAAGVSPAAAAAAAGAGPPVAEDCLTLLWQATMAGLLQDIACVFCCTGHGRAGGPVEEGAADDPADTPPASEAGSSRLGGANPAGVDLSATTTTSNVGRMVTTLDAADSSSLTDASSLSPSSSSGSIATSEDTVDWLAGLLQVLGPLLHHLAVQQKPLVSKLLVQQVLAAVGPNSNSNSRRGSALSSGSGISIGGATTLTDGTGAGSSRRASSISTAAECDGAASEVASIVGQSASSWLGLLQRMCTWPLAPLVPQGTPSGRLGWAARALPGAGSAGSSAVHVASAGSGPPAGALHAHDLQQQVLLLRGMAPAAAEAAYLAHVHATTWWMDATLGMFDIFCQVSMGQLSDMPASLAQTGLAATLAAQRHQLLTLVLVAVPWALLMALRPSLSRGNWRERMLLAAAACRSWCTLAPALGIMPHGAALAAGLSGRRWQVLAPIVGVGLFRPLQQQVRMRALLPIIFMECLGVCCLLGVYSSWSRALVRASCILVTASLSGILVERASRRLFLFTLQRQAAAIGPQGPQSCPSGPKDPPGHPHQRRHSEGPRGGSRSSGTEGAGAVKERLAERLRRRSQPVHST